jgi:two-component system OmpR family response regulator
MRILIIEDDVRLGQGIQNVLAKHHTTELVCTGHDAIQSVTSDAYELLILDLSLPDISGLEVCRRIRDLQLNMPILIVTGDDRPARVVELLDAGADDYIIKPFRVDVLKARIRALGRRQATREPAQRQLTIGDMVLDRNSHTVTRRGQLIHLRNKEFMLLEQLMLHPDIVMSRATLLDKAWVGDDEAWPNLIDVHIKFLRDKIDKPFGTHTIETVHGLGYCIRSNTTN